MKKNISGGIAFAVILLPVVLLAGCATSGKRLYPDVPMEQSATLIVDSRNYIQKFNDIVFDEWKVLGLFTFADNYTVIVPAGNHRIEWDRLSNIQQPITAVFEAGRRYYIDANGTITDRGPKKIKTVKTEKGVTAKWLYPDVPLEQSAILEVAAANSIHKIDDIVWNLNGFFGFTVIVPAGKHRLEGNFRRRTVVFQAGGEYYLTAGGGIIFNGEFMSSLMEEEGSSVIFIE